MFAGFDREAEDVRAAVLYVRNVLQKRVALLMGHSKGGAVVLLYSSKYDDIPLVRKTASVAYTLPPDPGGASVLRQKRQRDKCASALLLLLLWLRRCRLHLPAQQVVNLAGRLDMSSGIKERFGADVFERLAAQGRLLQQGRKPDGKVFQWELTQQARAPIWPQDAPTVVTHMPMPQLPNAACACSRRTHPAVPDNDPEHACAPSCPCSPCRPSLVQDLDNRMSTDMVAAASAIRASKVLTIHGTADAVIPVAEAYRYDELIAGHKLHIIQGADHNFRSPEHAKEMIKAVMAFVAADWPPLAIN